MNYNKIEVDIAKFLGVLSERFDSGGIRMRIL